MGKVIDFKAKKKEMLEKELDLIDSGEIIDDSQMYLEEIIKKNEENKSRLAISREKSNNRLIQELKNKSKNK